MAESTTASLGYFRTHHFRRRRHLWICRTTSGTFRRMGESVSSHRRGGRKRVGLASRQTVPRWHSLDARNGPSEVYVVPRLVDGPASDVIKEAVPRVGWERAAQGNLFDEFRPADGTEIAG